MREIIEDYLIMLGITPNLKGFSCICESLEIIRDEDDIKITGVYEIVARKFNTSSACVERRIRHAISKIDRETWKMIGGNGVKNAEFLYTLALIARKEKRNGFRK